VSVPRHRPVDVPSAQPVRGSAARLPRRRPEAPAREPVRPVPAREPVRPVAAREPLLRYLLGAALREVRTEQARTLREVAERARVSMPYLSEVERGRKEPSSEVLAALAGALDLRLADLLALAWRELATREPARPQPADRSSAADRRPDRSSAADRLRPVPAVRPVPHAAPERAAAGRRPPGGAGEISLLAA